MRAATFLLVVAAGAAAPAIAVADAPAQSGARREAASAALEAHRARLFRAASPAAKAKLTPAVDKVLERAALTPKPKEPPVDLLADAKAELARQGVGNLDLQALAFLALMQAAKSAQEDLKAIMSQVKAINSAKACKGDARCLASIKQRPGLSKETLDALDAPQTLGALAADLERRHQLIINRYDKLITTLSLLADKIADTADATVANVK